MQMGAATNTRMDAYWRTTHRVRVPPLAEYEYEYEMVGVINLVFLAMYLRLVQLYVLALTFGFSLSHCVADDTEPSAHEIISQYAKTIQALNEKHRDHLAKRAEIADQFQQLHAQFAAAGVEAESLSVQANAEFRNWLSAYSQAAIDQAELERTGNRPQLGIRPNFRQLQGAVSGAAERNTSQRVAQVQLASN